MNEIDGMYPNIWNYTERDAENLEQELGNLVLMQEHHENSIEHLEYVLCWVCS